MLRAAAFTRGPDPGLAKAGITLFRELPQTADSQVLLCTDLHGDNILATQREPWLVIDPKPYAGDPAYDLLQHMLNCEDRLAAGPAGLATRMAGKPCGWLTARQLELPRLGQRVRLERTPRPGARARPDPGSRSR